MLGMIVCRVVVARLQQDFWGCLIFLGQLIQDPMFFWSCNFYNVSPYSFCDVVGDARLIAEGFPYFGIFYMFTLNPLHSDSQYPSHGCVLKGTCIGPPMDRRALLP
jgi:hypothetical protein